MDTVVETLAVLPAGSTALVLSGVLGFVALGAGRSLMRDAHRQADERVAARSPGP